jgi:hypothetical protein
MKIVVCVCLFCCRRCGVYTRSSGLISQWIDHMTGVVPWAYRRSTRPHKKIASVRVRWFDHRCKVNSDEFDRVQERTGWRFLLKGVDGPLIPLT